MRPRPLWYLWRKLWRRRDPKGWAEVAGVIAALSLGGAVGWFTYIEDRLVNPTALIVAASFFAAYKTIETVVGAFDEEDNEFDEALGDLFKALSGWSVLIATGYVLVQTLLTNDPWFATSLLALCVMFAIWGAWRADKAQPSASPPVPSAEPKVTDKCYREHSDSQPGR